MAIYYVKPDTGSDLDSGLSIANAFASTNFAAATATAGDEVRLCVPGGPESPSSTIALGSCGGVRFRSCDASGDLTTDVYEINDANLPFADDLAQCENSSNVIFEFVHFKGTGNAFSLLHSLSDTVDAWRFIGCEFSGASDVGIDWNGPKDVMFFDGCSIHDNGSHGIIYGSHEATFNACSIYGNGGDGVNGWTITEVRGCSIYDNTSAGLRSTNGNFARLFDSTVYGNGSHGVVDDQKGGPRSTVPVILNSTIAGNGGYGVFFNDAVPTNQGEVGLIAFCHTDGNTSGASNATWSNLGRDLITGDPKFTDAANGDFTLASDSPLVGAGLGGSDIGAEPYCAPGGGSPVTRGFAI